MSIPLAFDRYHRDIKRGEGNYNRQAARGTQDSRTRAWIAVALVNLATRLQPELRIETQQPTQPATV